MLYFWKTWHVFRLIKNILTYKEIIVNGNKLGWSNLTAGGKAMQSSIRSIDMKEFHWQTCTVKILMIANGLS